MVDDPLHILKINSADIGGGAEKVALDLSKAYQERGHHCWLAVGEKRSHKEYVLQIPDPAPNSYPWSPLLWQLRQRLKRSKSNNSYIPFLISFLRHLVDIRGAYDHFQGKEYFNYPGTRQLLSKLPELPDVIHLHNLHGEYFDLRSLPWISQTYPVFITLHDEWLLTGHCAVSLGCKRWENGCGNCPDLSIYPSIRRDATDFNWKRKGELYSKSRFYVATPSRWLMDRVERSILAPAIIESRVIPNGVDRSVFNPGDCLSARRKLGIPANAFVMLFVAHGILQNRFKDYTSLRKSIDIVGEKLQNREILFIGLGEEGEDERRGNVTIRFVPFQKDANTVAQYYQAADIYLHAALADNFPVVILEALACGTPVIATSIGGIPEQIKDGRTGILVPPQDPDEMAARIVQLTRDDNLRLSMGNHASEDAAMHFDLDRQVDVYLDWYHQVLESSSKSSFGVEPSKFKFN
jgi:glycosyltransferase involved in cell wall biosynthesis